jgi:hypothetical protein
VFLQSQKAGQSWKVLKKIGGDDEIVCNSKKLNDIRKKQRRSSLERVGLLVLNISTLLGTRDFLSV